MNIYLVSIFPEIFESFINTSLIQKAQKKKLLNFFLVNPRDFCDDKHRQIDDEIYGWWKGMLLKAKPIIDSIEKIINDNKKDINSDFKIIFLSPSEIIFDQKLAHEFSEMKNLIFVCWRYEGIDHRFAKYFQDKYPSNFLQVSIWKFVTMGGELPAMTIIEAVTRLIPWVIKESDSWKYESYNVWEGMQNIEYPQYTRPEEIFYMVVPEVLMNWNHKKINEWRDINIHYSL